MNRRELLKGLAAGGIFVAGELWIPGQKLISIPKAAQGFRPIDLTMPRNAMVGDLLIACYGNGAVEYKVYTGGNPFNPGGWTTAMGAAGEGRPLVSAFRDTDWRGPVFKPHSRSGNLITPINT